MLGEAGKRRVGKNAPHWNLMRAESDPLQFLDTGVLVDGGWNGLGQRGGWVLSLES